MRDQQFARLLKSIREHLDFLEEQIVPPHRDDTPGKAIPRWMLVRDRLHRWGGHGFSAGGTGGIPGSDHSDPTARSALKGGKPAHFDQAHRQFDAKAMNLVALIGGLARMARAYSTEWKDSPEEVEVGEPVCVAHQRARLFAFADMDRYPKDVLCRPCGELRAALGTVPHPEVVRARDDRGRIDKQVRVLIARYHPDSVRQGAA